MTDHSLATRSIVIIGGGFAGAVTAMKLLDEAITPISVTVVEPREQVGRGVAYSTTERVHLVNAPARIFSLHPNDPDHFSNWLARNADGHEPEAGGFAETCAPRWIYGSYVISELERSVKNAQARGSSYEHVRARAQGLKRVGGGLKVLLEDGRQLEVDEVVLALGVFKAQPRPAEAAVSAHPNFVANPWDREALDRIASAREVLLIGTSLSMVDVVASLEARGFKGSYQAISRRGHLVEARRDAVERPDFLADQPLPTTALALLRRVKAERRAIWAEGGDWRGLLWGLRPHISALWQGASTRERVRFARHLRSIWDVTLHQAAAVARRPLEIAEREGRFASAAARLINLDHDGERFAAQIRWRSTGQEDTRNFDAVVDCRGHQEHDWRRIDDPFVKSLLQDGVVRPHATGFGLDATRDGQVIDQHGQLVTGLYAIGHPLRGVAWESSSITEQLTQAVALADRLSATPLNVIAAE